MYVWQTSLIGFGACIHCKVFVIIMDNVYTNGTVDQSTGKHITVPVVADPVGCLWCFGVHSNEVPMCQNQT